MAKTARVWPGEAMIKSAASAASPEGFQAVIQSAASAASPRTKIREQIRKNEFIWGSGGASNCLSTRKGRASEGMPAGSKECYMITVRLTFGFMQRPLQKTNILY